MDPTAVRQRTTYIVHELLRCVTYMDTNANINHYRNHYEGMAYEHR